MDFAYLALAAALILAALIVFFALRRPQRAEPPAPDPRLDALIAAQGEIKGQFQLTVEAQRMLSERLDALSKQLGSSLKENTDKTAETLGGIQTRLTVIDEAQKNISALSGQVVSLQQVLSNKQARGAFGQAQMEDIVRDGLPSSLYDFQFTLSNRNRPDCVIRIPGNRALIVIDSKFPLECFDGLRKASNEEEKKAALARVRADVTKHVNDIAQKYLIPGEVQTPAMMFVPSESIYADLHDGFVDLIQKAHRAQVIVVSPNMLMLAINTIQTVMKDARMREQASRIQKEVGLLVADVRRLDERVHKLQTHFSQAETDLKDITVSAEKIVTRGDKIGNVDLSGPDEAPSLAAPT
ncbi:MAG TPA: DNA recombination protein RmuC [Rhizomicrobium sp.]|nr:DNA recombination protein RmuC [Rhizomicrobium sp.]